VDEIIRHVFATLTYTRKRTKTERWKQAPNDFNRYIQKFRRLHNSPLQYLRVVEQHKDGYPHFHIILQFPNACIRIRDLRWFERKLYQNWKTQWTHGHSDYQKPRRNNIGTISYVMKYLLKNTTQKTIWKKILVNTNTESSAKQQITSAKNVDEVKLNGVKLCTWSRNFDWEPFKTSFPQRKNDY